MKLLKHFKRPLIVLGLLFLLALSLRVVNLSNLPNGFFTDEVVSGYVGRFVLQNGVDPYGNVFPLFYFDKFGDFRVILPMYITGIFTFLFGSTEFAVRFPVALSGALLVFPLYYFVVELTKNKKKALVSSLFAAILPWHIVLSRAQSEGIIGLTVFVTALFLLVRSIRLKNKKYLVFAVLLCASTYLLYPNFRLLSPLAVFPALFLVKERRWRMYIIAAGTILLVFTALVLQTNWGKGRYDQTSFFGSREIAGQIQSSIDAGTSPDPSVFVARVHHNKPLLYVKELTNLYFEYFSPQFLFLNGGLPYRYTIPNVGLIFITFSIFYLSFAFLSRNTKDNSSLFLLSLLLISPLPSLATIDDVPNINRALFMTVPLVVIAAIGAISLIESFGKFKKLLVAVFFLVILGEAMYIGHQYVYHAETFKSVLRQDQFRELSRFVVDQHSNYSKVYLPVYETLPVYYAYYSENYDRKLAGKFKYGLVIDQIDNVVFVKDMCPAKLLGKDYFEKGSLIIQSGECHAEEGFIEEQKFMRRDSTEAFRVLRVE
mgnify:CR=1 FL=1